MMEMDATNTAIHDHRQKHRHHHPHHRLQKPLVPDSAVTMSDPSSTPVTHSLPPSSTSITASVATPKPIGIQSNIVVVDGTQQPSAEDDSTFLKQQLIGSATANSFAIDPALDPYNNKKLKPSAYPHHHRQQSQQQQQEQQQSPPVSAANPGVSLVASADTSEQQGFYQQELHQQQLNQQQIHQLQQQNNQHFQHSHKTTASTPGLPTS